MNNLETPTNELVAKYIEIYNNDIKYSATDKAIESVIKEFSQNVKLENILLKVCIINSLYSTNIYDTFRMASHIFDLQIDEFLVSNDLSIVSRIANGHGIIIKKSGNERCLYSFATKYCHWHSRESYPIYDSFVSGLLIDYRKKDKFSIFTDSDLMDYEKFNKIILEFKNWYSLTDHNIKHIDKFLWIYGKSLSEKAKAEKGNQ